MLKDFVRCINNAFVRIAARFCLLVVLAVSIASIPSVAQQCPRDRAMWIYRTPDVVNNRAERDEVFRFATDPIHRINEFFLAVHLSCPSADRCTLDGESYRAALRVFLLKAHHRNIRVHALFGEPRFALEQNHRRVQARVQAILDFNDRSQPDQKFDGIHLDVEPHVLNREQYGFEYRDDPIGTLRQFLDMNAMVLAQLSASNLSYGVDIPDIWHPFVDEFGHFQELEEFQMVYNDTTNYPTYHLMNMVKDVAFMSYRHPRATIRRVAQAMEYAARPDVGARVYIGVQTSPRSLPQRPWTYGQGSTFSDGTKTGMEQHLCTIDSEFNGLLSLGGFAYFKYSSYAAMPD